MAKRRNVRDLVNEAHTVVSKESTPAYFISVVDTFYQAMDGEDAAELARILVRGDK